MILIDVGNTTMHIGITAKTKITKSFRIFNKTATRKKLLRILGTPRSNKVILCSVAPTMTRILTAIRKDIIVVGKNVTVPIHCMYNSRQVGQDRLVNAYAAGKIYPRSKIIIDFGSAITIDFLGTHGAYRGGFILPGINSYLDSLTKCELLPKRIRIQKAHATIPHTTTQSISLGLLEGFSIMLNGFVKKYRKKLYDNDAEIIVTGGESKLLRKMLLFNHTHDALLTLKGLFLLSAL